MEEHTRRQQRNEHGDDPAWIVRRDGGEQLGVIRESQLSEALERPDVKETLAAARRTIDGQD